MEERERPNIFLAGNSSPCRRSTATDIKDVASDRNRVDDPHRLCTLVNWKIPRLPANSRARGAHREEGTRRIARGVSAEKIPEEEPEKER